MNETTCRTSNGAAKAKCKLKRRHFYLIGSLALVGIFATYLADYASRDTTIKGLAVLGTLTLVIALAAFFKAYSKD